MVVRLILSDCRRKLKLKASPQPKSAVAPQRLPVQAFGARLKPPSTSSTTQGKLSFVCNLTQLLSRASGFQTPEADEPEAEFSRHARNARRIIESLVFECQRAGQSCFEQGVDEADRRSIYIVLQSTEEILETNSVADSLLAELVSRFETTNACQFMQSFRGSVPAHCPHLSIPRQRCSGSHTAGQSHTLRSAWAHIRPSVLYQSRLMSVFCGAELSPDLCLWRCRGDASA